MIAISSAHKKTNAYVNEWVAWHLSLGFDRIIIYDDNDKDYPYIGDFIDNQYKDKVVIVPSNKEDGECVCSMQARVINKDIQEQSDVIEWCAFIDSDEYIHIDNYNSVQEWLSNAPSYVSCIALNWRIYGDDGVIVGDESKPVQSRFVKCMNDIHSQQGRYYGNMVKKIIRLNKSITADDMFIFRDENDRLDMYDCNFTNQGKCAVMIGSECSDYKCYINHYVTKSLSECIKYKCGDLWCADSLENYYFMFNERTAEKEKYIKENILI